MPWDERLIALFDDLEQQAEGLALSARDAGAAELGRSEYARVGLADRLHGSLGRRLELSVAGVGRLRATLLRPGLDWCLVTDGTHEWLVRMAALSRVGRLGEQARDVQHRPLAARLGFGSALRGVSDEAVPVLVHLLDGSTARGLVRRVGADFVEIAAERDDGGLDSGGGPVALPFAGVAAVRRG